MGQPCCISSESSRKNCFSCLFQLLEVTCIPWLMTSSSIFKASSIASSNLSDSDPPYYTRPIWIIQYVLPSQEPWSNHTQTPFCPHSQALGMSMWTSLGPFHQCLIWSPPYNLLLQINFLIYISTSGSDLTFSYQSKQKWDNALDLK